MLSQTERDNIVKREQVKMDYLKKHKKNWLSPDEQNKLPKVTNEERSAVEVFDFINNIPDKYFLYVNEEKKTATTWTGEKLGNVSFGREYKSVFGDKRVPINVFAINGKKYHGTFYKSAGDYARIQLFKN